jgi:hypothetical protein
MTICSTSAAGLASGLLAVLCALRFLACFNPRSTGICGMKERLSLFAPDETNNPLECRLCFNMAQNA